MLSIASVLSFLHSVFAFVIILVPLVVFHEFGHYVFAKLFGVKAETFSVGFGPRLWGRKIGETDWRISAIPLGGYVKLLGEDRDAEISPEDQKRALHKQAPWKRFLIFFGGPLFNFILAIFIFMAILAIGEPQMASVVGRVVHGSAAEKAGFQNGDKIVEIDGKPVKKFDEVFLALNESPGKKLDFTVLHPKSEQPVHISVATTTQSGFSVYGESKAVGEVDGLLPMPRAQVLGVSNPQSVAGQAGLKTGDRIVKINQEPIHTWEEVESTFERIPEGALFSIYYSKPNSEEVKTLNWTKPVHSAGLGKDFGLHSSELFVDKAVPNSPAEGAHIQTGDRLIRVGDREVYSFFDLKDAVQKAGEKDGVVQLHWERDGKVHTASIQPTATAARDPLLNKVTHFTVGVIPMLVLAEPVTYIERILNPFKLVYMATDRMITFSWRNLISLQKMFTGDVSMGSIGGPIMIGKIAGESMTRGLIVFLTNMAIFSIGLGVLNILPVPVLDGGHLMLLGVEMIRKKPLTLRQMEVVQGFGLIFILALMGIAFHNDIARLFYS
jgi:regulator of sigma E protease